jgi:hypothetical protein
VRIRLDGDHAQLAARERKRERACPGAYLDDELAGDELRLVDNLVGRRRIKKVLANLTNSNRWPSSRQVICAALHDYSY